MYKEKGSSNGVNKMFSPLMVSSAVTASLPCEVRKRKGGDGIKPVSPISLLLPLLHVWVVASQILKVVLSVGGRGIGPVIINRGNCFVGPAENLGKL